MQFELNKIQQSTVNKLIDKYKNEKQEGRLDKAYTNGITATECKVLESVFAELLPNQKISHAMVLVEFIPLAIHTDWPNNNDKNPASVMLIPYETCKANTLIFNEQGTTNSAGMLDNYPIVENHIDETTYDQYLSHQKWNKVQKLSLYEIYKWQHGTGVIWDRRKLHCSDNFLKNGVTTKIALTIFTEHKE